MLNVYHGRCVALAVCILILLSVLSGLPSEALPRWQGTHADAKPTGSTAGVEETQSMYGPTIQDFNVNTTQCSASVQWNFTVSAPTNGLQNVTFCWNNGTTDMGNMTITYTNNPNSANALFNGILPSTAQNVTFQCWAYNAYNYGTTGVRWILVYPSNSSNPYFLDLGTAISTVENANNWTYTGVDPNELYMGVVLQQNTTAQLQSMIDSFATSQDWVDVLKWSAISNKLGFTQQNDICYALGNYTMEGNLPFTQNDTWGTPSFCVENQWALYGYYYANTTWNKAYSGYDASKWNIASAYQQFDTAVNYSIITSVYHALPLWIHSNSTGITFMNRYYDEDADTIECYILFANLLNISDAMNKALYWWNYLVNTHWTGSFFKYAPNIPDYECEAPFFLEIISMLKYYNVALANWTLVLTDIGNRFLSSEWTSAQWWHNVVCHASIAYGIFGNSQLRLENTLGAWQALLGVYLQLNATYQNNLKDMLFGNVNTQQAWNLLLQSGLYDNNTSAFRCYTAYSTDPESTSYGEVLMWLMGIVPDSTTTAFPLEELNYEYIQDIDPQMLQFSLRTQTITVPVNDAGSIAFQYGVSPVACVFNQSGIWQVKFSNSWNMIVNVTYVSALPTNHVYFMQTYTPPLCDVTIGAYCTTERADVGVQIAMDGSSTGHTTPYTFSALNGTHTFTVPNSDAAGDPFRLWSTGQTTTNITVSSDGTYVAYYGLLLVHDVAVTSIALSKTVVGQSYGVNVSVIVQNLGDFPETFNVTLYANTTAIGNLTVTNLPNATFALITFVWNTSGYSYGNYSISAHAWPVSSETDLTDNTFVDGQICVSIPGDVDGVREADGKLWVDLNDLVLLALSYNSKRGDTRWNPNADIDGSGQVDLADLVILAQHYNQHYP